MKNETEVGGEAEPPRTLLTLSNGLALLSIRCLHISRTARRISLRDVTLVTDNGRRVRLTDDGMADAQRSEFGEICILVPSRCFRYSLIEADISGVVASLRQHIDRSCCIQPSNPSVYQCIQLIVGDRSLSLSLDTV